MVLEGSTGYSGSFARQITINKESADDDLMDDILSALEMSAGEGAVVLEGDGIFLEDAKSSPVSLQFDANFEGGVYVTKSDDRKSFTRDQLVTLASSGKFVGTFSARHGERLTSNIHSRLSGQWDNRAAARPPGFSDFAQWRS
jgi:hypothetical protein